MSQKKVVTAIVIGCGNRGEVYSTYALKHPDRFSIVGIAESKEHVRGKFLERYAETIDKNKVFADWRDIFKAGEKLSDCVIITLPDKLHKEAAVESLKHGYHILLEKPMATSLDDCKEIASECEKNPHLINAVCHVLRYYDACVKLKQIIDSGLIGEVVNINHTEPVGFWHFAHSFVRGNWRNEAQSTFSLLAKCCHDIDLLIYWMGAKKRCVSVSSFGSLVHFRKENAPNDSTSNCFSCPVENDCVYSTKKIYLNANINPNFWPWSVVLDTDIFTLMDAKVNDIEDILKEKTDSEKVELIEKCLSHPKSRYGRCVYKCDNDVCDNQVVIMNFDDNSIATLTMIAYSKNTCTRQTKIYGTKGELEWDDAVSSTNILHTDFLTNKKQIIDAKADTIFTHMPKSAIELNKNIAKLSGHGGKTKILY